MATVVIGDGYAANIDSIDVALLTHGRSTVTAATTYTLAYDAAPGVLETLCGRGFTFDSHGALVGGTVTGFQEIINGTAMATVSGANVSASDMVAWALRGDNGALRDAFFGGADTIDGGTRGDLLRGFGGDDLIAGGMGADSIDGGAGDNILFGGGGNDQILSGPGFNRVNGNTGDDTIIGSSRVGDWLSGGQGADLVDATVSGGHNILNGGLGDDTLSAGGAGDTLRGGQGDDVVHGGAGDDLIFGDLGNNTLTGGAGADIFHSGNGAAQDTITDFSQAQGDRVQIGAGLTWTTTQVGADTHVDVSNGDIIVLQHTQLSVLTERWIFMH